MSSFPILTLRDLFDADFYRANSPDLANFSDDKAFEHFRDLGVFQQRRFSPYFDLNFYLTNNPDVRTVLGPLFTSPSAPLEGANLRLVVDHFINNGVYEGRRFSPYINLNFYKQENPDLAGLNGSQLLNHLIKNGIAEGRQFSPLFDVKFYRENNPDLKNLNNLDLFDHFVQFGLAEGRQFLPLIDVSYYRDANPDLSVSVSVGSPPRRFTNEELVNHFVNFGLREGRRFSPYFDINYYYESNPDLALAGLDKAEAFNHFQRFGLNEGRRFSRFFDVNYYLANNLDLRAAGLNRQQAFNHFLNFGLKEGRRPSLLFDPVYYLNNNPDLLAQQFSFQNAFREFQIGQPPQETRSGFQLARPASILFEPRTIAPMVTSGATTQAERLRTASRWDDIPVGGTLTYSFVTTASAFLYEGPETNVREVLPGVKQNVRNIMRQYSSLVGINLVEVPDRPPNVGRIRILYSDLPQNRNNSVVVSFGPTDSPGDGRAGDVHLSPNNDFAAGPGSPQYEDLLFGVGGALGLNRQVGQGDLNNPSAVALPLSKKNNTNTVMVQDPDPNYNGAFARSPMPYDLAALQFLYGASYLNDTDTVYRYDSGNFINVKQAIWDAGGNDTLDFSGLPVSPPDFLPPGTPPPPLRDGYYFDMNEGGQLTAQNALNRAIYRVPSPQTPGGGTQPTGPSSVTSVYNTSIAFGSQIENLVGSPGDDEILGTNSVNNINGNAGNDQITGAQGGDILTGGPGQDVFAYARGDGSTARGGADVITDFNPLEDRIGLGISLRLDQIAIAPGSNPNDSLIGLADTGEFLALLRGVPVSALSSGIFVTV